MRTSEQFDIADFLPYLLNQAGEVTSREFQQYYKDRYGLLRTEWRVLFHLGRFGHLTAVEISQRVMIHKTKISRAIARLSGYGLVQGSGDVNDRRKVNLSLTNKGQNVFQDLVEKAAEFDQRCTADLTDKDVSELRRILKKFSGLEPL